LCFSIDCLYWLLGENSVLLFLPNNVISLRQSMWLINRVSKSFFRFVDIVNIKQAHNCDYKCVNCATLEFSSSQFIIKLLYKELNEAHVLQCHVLPRWMKLLTSRSCLLHGLSWHPRILMIKGAQLIQHRWIHGLCPQTSNRYSVLSYLPESTTKGHETIPSKSEVRNLGNKHRPRWRQRVLIKYETGSEQEREGTTDLVQRQIPTLVNGQVCITKKSDSRQCVNDKSSNTQSVLRESSRRLLIKKNEFTNPLKHKVLLVEDSHLRGCAAHMKSILNDQFEVCGYINSGASSKIVMESAKNDIKNLHWMIF
jgi:hypothetical protein